MATKVSTKVIDADAHVVETERTWEFMDPADARYRPTLYLSADGTGKEAWNVGGKLRPTGFNLSRSQLAELSRKQGFDLALSPEGRNLDDVGARLADMDAMGVDVQVLFNSFWLTAFTDDPAAEAAICRGWNRWMADAYAKSNGRLPWTCVVPLLSMDEAVRQLREAREHGAVGVMMRPIEGERLLVDEAFYPLYQEAERLDMCIAVHVSNASPTVVEGMRSVYDRAASFYTLRVPTVGSSLVVMMSDVPVSFPTLRWAFIEVSAQWVPWIVKEVRRRGRKLGRPVPDDVLAGYNVYVSCETDDDLPIILKYAGEDNLVIGTDYGHTDISGENDAISTFRRREDVSEAVKRKILSDNPKRLYGL
ncbi:MAG: amidohydrolase family protein [Chloroflexota bacterium]